MELQTEGGNERFLIGGLYGRKRISLNDPKPVHFNCLWPTSIAPKPHTSPPSTVGCRMRTQVPFSDTPVTTASKLSPILDSTRSAAADFSICCSTFLQRLPLLCGVSRAPPIIKSVDRGFSRHRCFEQPMGDQIGVLVIRGAGVSVIFDRQTEVPACLAARRFNGIFSCTQQFDHTEGKVRTVKRIGYSRVASREYFDKVVRSWQ